MKVRIFHYGVLTLYLVMAFTVLTILQATSGTRLFVPGVIAIWVLAAYVYMRTGKAIADAMNRALFTEIGYFSGNVSALDRRYAEENNMKPLGRFWKWLLRDWISWEKTRRSGGFKQVVYETLGEYP